MVRPFGIGGPRIKVIVTERDVEWATRGDSSRCMVARAIARTVPDAHHIEVDTQTIRFSIGGDQRYAYLTPIIVQNYVRIFDAGEPVEPFRFTMRDPMQIKRRLTTPEDRDKARVRLMTEAIKAPVDRIRRVKQTYVGEGRRAAPRVFKTKARAYGDRVLRINQPRQEETSDV